MMEFLPELLYILGAILLVVLIILGIKLIITMNKIENVVDDISGKIQSLNGFFSIVDYTTDKLAMISDKIADTLSSLVGKLFKRKKESESEEDE